VRGRIDGWINRSLSIAGRAELMKSVLHNMLAYWVCSYKIPNTVVRELERLFTNFLWNKMHAWGWSDICKTKALGGLGI